MFCVHIFCKHFQFLMTIKGDKNVINIPPLNVRTKTLQAIGKPLFFEMTNNALSKVGPNGDLMATPSNWQKYLLSNVKNDSQEANLRSLEKKLFIQFSMISSNGMLVKRFFTFKLSMMQLASKLATSSTN